MIVLAIVQSWNANDPVRGFTVGWVRQIAREAGRVIVIALEKREESADPRVTVVSLGKEGYSGFGFRYVLNWHRAMRQAFGQYRPDVIFTHMTPLYSILAYPYAKFYGVPVVTWFLHPRGSLITRIAHYLSSRIVSASRDSYPYPDRKLVAIGHGIDTDFFVSDRAPKALPPIIISVGRISPIKNNALLIAAAAILKRTHPLPFSLVFIGSPHTVADRSYRADLLARVAASGLSETVRFVPALSRDVLRDQYRRATLHVNCTESGSGDKVVLEAMACGTPSLAISPIFSDSFGAYRSSVLCPPDPVALARHMGDILSMSPRTYAAFGNALRLGVHSHNSLPVFSKRLVGVFHALRTNR